MEEALNQPVINQKQIKREETTKIDEDRISLLPDCLLIEILARLSSTKDAIRMGTLSKRWQYLWTSIPNLIFRDLNRKQPLFHFYSFVDETLSKCRQSKLHKFELVTVYHPRFESQLNNWICYAINCNVEDFTLILWDSACEAEFLRHRFFYTSSCFTHLTLEGCIFNPSGQISWNNLKSLSISHGKLDEDLIENILSGSPLLETVNLDRCYGYRRIDITSKSVKYLVFCGYTACRGDEDLPKIIEINAPYILSLTFKYDLLAGKLLLLDMSSLVKANLDYMIK